MLSNRSYALALAVTGLVTMLSIIGFALYLIPMHGMIIVGSGDLTRIGWYSNNRYGNHKPNLAFRPSLVTQSETLNRHYDVVIIGDSFSLDLEKSWPNYLAAKGLSVLVVSIADDPAKKSGTAVDVENQIMALIQSPAFRDTPPSVFVFQTIERFAKRRLVGDTQPCLDTRKNSEGNTEATPMSATLTEPLTLVYKSPPDFRIEEVNMPPVGRYDEQQLTYARDFLLKNIRKAFGWELGASAFRLHVPRFSSDRPETLLVVSSDLAKKDWNQQDVEVMECQLLRLQQAVQSNGKTLFVALPIPDKLSAYHDDLVDPAPPRGVVDLLTDPRLNRPPVEKALRSEIAAGEIDVYLPNDTHFGARGHALTAETVLRFIEERTRRVDASGMPSAPRSKQADNPGK